MRVALITGAARGLGRVIAADLAADHPVAVTYRDSDPAALLAEVPGIHAIQADLRDPGAAEAVIAEVVARFGRLDVLVNNAGLVAGTPMEPGGFDAAAEIFAVNAVAPMALLTAALPHLRAGAAVVNISSVNAALPPQGAAAYGASKAALENLTRAAAKELGPRGIRVNAVAPGAIALPEAPRADALVDAFARETALGRIATPQEVAAAVRYLASDAASFVTGQVLTVSGGYRL
ncbi:SDR family oxidoreductase [Rhodobacteraceae bacterium CCMM004]|nr:SDR family oxidoreductase [Rhodobacteraceae bacterium CCMM004]